MKTNSSKLELTAARLALAQTVPDAYGAAQPSEAASMNGGTPAESQRDYETVEGTVGQLSYSPSANANGFYLENGTLVEAPPHMYIGGLVEEGSPVEVTGYRVTGTFGEDVIHEHRRVRERQRIDERSGSTRPFRFRDRWNSRRGPLSASAGLPLR